MQHRHLMTSRWTLAAVDSAIEYGDLADWRELSAAVAADRQLARQVLKVANARGEGSGHALAKELTELLWPNLARN